MKLSVVLATRNEEQNIDRCLESVRGIADEIIVVDEYSTDKTIDVSKKHGAKVFLEPHHDIFHVTKQKALEKAKGDWVLQLDADEVVTKELAKQILMVVNNKLQITKIKPLFIEHQKLIETRDGKIGKPTGEIVGYFIPRKNIFLGKPLIHAGVYPDGVIRLVKNGKAWFPQKSVHEQIVLKGEVSWLSGDLLHYDSPTFRRYLTRLNRYTDLYSSELQKSNTAKNLFSFIFFVIWRPVFTFLNLYFVHKGFLDNVQGFIWSFFSAMHHPIAYFKCLTNQKK